MNAATKLYQIVQMFRALSDQKRVQIATLLAGSGEMCVNDLVDNLGIAQPALSYHLKILSDAGLLARRKAGSRSYYRISSTFLRNLVLGHCNLGDESHCQSCSCSAQEQSKEAIC
ncbi:MAG: metalloregulator ArsR/SmtB family transcription factor [Bacillota bacterium]